MTHSAPPVIIQTMGKGLMRKAFAAVLTAAALFAAAGCGGVDGDPPPDRSLLQIKKNGRVEQTIVEPFDREYYDLEELEDMIQQSCQEYNDRMGRGRVSAKRASLEDGVLTVEMRYKSAEDFADFNGQAMFVGTVDQARDAGYQLDMSLESADAQLPGADLRTLLSMGDSHLLLWRGEGDVSVWGEILYYSSGVELSEDDLQTVTFTDPEKLSMIVFA